MTKQSKKPAKKKKMSATKRNLFMDIGLTLGFMLVYSQEFTGTTLHEWLGVSFMSALIVHVIWHWKWVVSITKRFFGKLPRKTRINYIINGGLAFAFSSIMFTGLMMSESFMPTLGLPTSNLGIWEDFHEAASSLSILLVGGHIFMHLKWIKSNIKKYLLPKRPKLA